MASYSVHFIIFIQVTMLVDVSNCFDNRTKCQLCDDNNNNNNVTICSDFNAKNKTTMQCNNRNVSDISNNFKYVLNRLSADNSSTELYLEFLENFSVIDLKSFPNVTIVKIKANEKLIDLNKVKNCANITVLNLTSNTITTVPNLTMFTNLQVLDLSHNLIENMSAIIVPPKVEILNLSSNNLNIDNNITLPENLKSLNLSKNDIKSTDNVTITGLLKKLDLRENQLTSVKPFTNLATLEELYLSNNNISNLDDGVFARLSSLIRLDLSANNLTSLGERCFVGLNRLQHLDISENLVFSVEPGTFQYMTNLVWLKLSGNVNLGELLLGTGQRLQTIDASRTNLTKIPWTLTRSVSTLRLAENKISYLQCGDLDSYPLLKILNLTQNKIQDIEDDALGRLEFLNYLLLSANFLKTIPRSLPDNLIVLDLNGNRIESLTINDFVGLAKLRTLVLRKNMIQSISDGTFAQLASLEVLDLSENPVRVLYSNTFIGPRKLKQLILTSLGNLTPRKEVLSFPVPETGQLQLLNVSCSPILANQLLDDIAALTMFKQLTVLDISYGNITNIKLDLDRYLPRLKMLVLNGNKLNCTINTLTLAKLLRKLEDNRQKDEDDDDEECYQYLSHRETNSSAQNAHENKLRIKYCEHCFSEPFCSFPDNLRGKPVRSLNYEDFSRATTTSTSTSITKAITKTWTTMMPTTMVTPSKTTETIAMTTATMTTLPVTMLASPRMRSLNTLSLQNNTLTTVKSTTRSTAAHESRALPDRNNNANLINFTLPLLSDKTSNETTKGSNHQQNDNVPTESNFNSSYGTAITPLLINYLNATSLSSVTWNQLLKHHYETASSSNASTTEHSMYYNASANNNNMTTDDNTTINETATIENDYYNVKPYENVTDQIKTDAAFLASKDGIKKGKVSSTSHPGMFVFLSVLSIILMASVIMMSSQWRQYRYRLEMSRGYMPQQDIEVRSLSSVGGYDLW